MNKFLAVCLLTLAISFGPTVAQAALVSWHASGSVWGVTGDALVPHFSVGDTVDFHFMYDTESIPLLLIPDKERLIRLESVSVSVGNQSFNAHPIQQNLYHPKVAILNDRPYDEFIVPYLQLQGLELPDLEIPEFYFGLVDYSATRFDADLVPPITLGNLECGFYCSFLSFEDPVARASRRVIFDVRDISVTSTPIPVPATLWLIGSALGAFGLLGKRKVTG